MNWTSVIFCIIFAALFPDLPLLAGRVFGYQSHMPVILSVAMFLVSGMYLWAYIAGTASLKRWLASAWAATALIGVFSGLLATLGLFGAISANAYNIFRGFPSHLIQGVTVIFILFYMLDSSPKSSVGP